jgi:hydrogenase nickel incorporation protein HypA/HybF
MHELGVTQRLLDLALDHAAHAGGTHVTDLHIAIGALSTFCEDAVSFCWEHLAQGTACDGARLHFRRIPAELTCQDCGDVHPLRDELGPCPRCGSRRLRVTAGDDLLLESLEVETATEEH